VPDELARWAAKRAPELLARAEAQAVEELKRALVDAALGTRAERTAPAPARPAAPPPAAARPTSPSGHGLWAYCVATAGEPLPEGLSGVHADGEVHRLEHAGLVALASQVPLAEFGEESLRRNLNDLEWLERVARAHEAVLERTLETATIVPLRLCTIFEDEDGVRRMLDDQRGAFTAALDLLAGRQEWGVKLLVERETLEAAAREQLGEEGSSAEEHDSPTAGGAYLQRRRLERRVREEADRLAVAVAEEVHARLQDWASDAVLNPPQNRDLSGHEGEMLLNGAYLVETPKVERLRALVAELEDRHRALGVRLEMTGPWPPYNFVPRDPAAAALT
jgi:Gas vesicle synthesis protein GvpL/GvpF